MSSISENLNWLLLFSTDISSNRFSARKGCPLAIQNAGVSFKKQRNIKQIISQTAPIPVIYLQSYMSVVLNNEVNKAASAIKTAPNG